MKKYIANLTVVENRPLNDTMFLTSLKGETPLPEMRPGQFAEVRVDNEADILLRRPISINFVDYDKNELWLLIQKAGRGTRRLSMLKAGDCLNLVMPLGNGFTMPAPEERCILIGGGVGVAPLLYLGHEIKRHGGKPVFLLGARTESLIAELDLFQSLGDTYVTTEDGSMGEKGFVTGHSILQNTRFDRIYTCGPQPMMKSVVKYASATDTDCEVSLENRMACGIGACLCCVEKTTEGHICVCKEGPVFNSKKLLWQI